MKKRKTIGKKDKEIKDLEVNIKEQEDLHLRERFESYTRDTKI